MPTAGGKKKLNISNQIKCSRLESYSFHLLALVLFSHRFSDGCCSVSIVEKTAPAAKLLPPKSDLPWLTRGGAGLLGLGNGRGEAGGQLARLGSGRRRNQLDLLRRGRLGRGSHPHPPISANDEAATPASSAGEGVDSKPVPYSLTPRPARA